MKEYSAQGYERQSSLLREGRVLHLQIRKGNQLKIEKCDTFHCEIILPGLQIRYYLEK